MGYIKIIAVFFLITLVSIGIVSADIIGTTDKEVQAATGPVLDNILEGFRMNDYAMYSKDFAATLKESVSQKRFLEIDHHFEETIGECAEKKYLGFITKGEMTVALWKARFTKSEDDVLIRLVLSKRDDEYFVTSLWFQ